MEGGSQALGGREVPRPPSLSIQWGKFTNPDFIKPGGLGVEVGEVTPVPRIPPT